MVTVCAGSQMSTHTLTLESTLRKSTFPSYRLVRAPSGMDRVELGNVFFVSACGEAGEQGWDEGTLLGISKMWNWGQGKKRSRGFWHWMSVLTSFIMLEKLELKVILLFQGFFSTYCSTFSVIRASSFSPYERWRIYETSQVWTIQLNHVMMESAFRGASMNSFYQ